MLFLHVLVDSKNWKSLGNEKALVQKEPGYPSHVRQQSLLPARKTPHEKPQGKIKILFYLNLWKPEAQPY